MKLQSFVDGYLDFRIVRAFVKDAETQRRTGVLVDFSAKLIAVKTNKKGEVISESHLTALNGLNIRPDRRGQLYVGSMKNEYVDGRDMLQKVYALTMFPFNGEEVKTEEQLRAEEAFMEGLLDEIYNFIEKAQARASTPKETKMPDTERVRRLQTLGTKAEQERAKKNANSNGKGEQGGQGDIPF